MRLAPILAHGLPSPPGVPVPGYLFAWAAALVLVASFTALGALWQEPRLDGARPRSSFPLPAWLEPACGALGVAIFALTVYAGTEGTPVPTRNFAPTFVYVVFWVALVPVTLLLGDVFSLFNPWRAVGRAAGWVTARAPKGSVAPHLPYPAWLGYWPAAVGLTAFAWLELVEPSRSSPDTVARAALVYAAVQLVGMAFFGVEAWARRADGFSVYFGLLARLSPVQRRGREVEIVRPLSAATTLDVGAGLVAVLCVMIGTTGFDGLSSTVQWSELEPRLVSALGTPELAATAGLAFMIGLVAAVFRMGVSGMRSVDPSHTRADLAARFIHTLIPIAAAYVVAHYFTFLVFQGQAMGTLVADPLGRGTAAATIDYSLISKAAVWYVQVGALVCGHVAGLVLAHDRALVIYEKGRRATRSQYWMLSVMVGFTSLGLFLLASIKR